MTCMQEHFSSRRSIEGSDVFFDINSDRCKSVYQDCNTRPSTVIATSATTSGERLATKFKDTGTSIDPIGKARYKGSDRKWG